MSTEVDTDLAERTERFVHTPRPLNFIRVRLYRGGQAELIRDVLEDEKDDLLEDLGAMRAAGKTEDDPEVEKCRSDLRHIINALRDITMGMIELAGPDGL